MWRIAFALKAVLTARGGRYFGRARVMKHFWKQGVRAWVVTNALATGIAPAFAEGPGWTANSTVKKLVVTSDGGVNVLLSPPLTNCVSNSGYGSGFASVYPNHPGINRIKADLLAAYLNGTPVALYLGDNTCKVLEIILGGW
jgi:hypothetical protein